MGIDKLTKFLALISILTLFIGIITVEYYYAQFSVRYQFLNLPISHIIYRGVTSVYTSIAILFIYLITGLWVLLQGRSFDSKILNILFSNNLVSFLIVIAVIVISYSVSKNVGILQAQKDLSFEESTLPEIISLEVDSAEDLKFGRTYRLLNMSNSYVVYFEHSEDDNPRYVQLPTVWINKSHVTKLILRR